MKTVIFDVDGALGCWEDGEYRLRDFFDIIMHYCAANKVQVYLCTEVQIYKGNLSFETIKGYYTGVFSKKENPPRQPDLVITSDENFAKKFSSVLVPPHSMDFNEFACLSLGGRIIDLIKDRVVLGKQAAETEKIEPESEKNDGEDITNFGFSI